MNALTASVRTGVRDADDGGHGDGRVLAQAVLDLARPDTVSRRGDDVVAVTEWPSGKTGKTYRLLSEAEWEYVARAGTTTPYHFGHGNTPLSADYQSTRGKTVSVGRYGANAFGLQDMHGNVWEWVEDCWNGTYSGAPGDGTPWTSGDCRRRLLRGGAWYYQPKGASKNAFRRSQSVRIGAT